MALLFGQNLRPELGVPTINKVKPLGWLRCRAAVADLLENCATIFFDAMF